MRSEAEIRQLMNDLVYLIQHTENKAANAESTASYCALEWVLGISDNGGPTDHLNTLRTHVIKWKAQKN